MNNFDFLQQVLGNEGYYCVIGLKTKNDPPVQKFYPTIEQAHASSENLVNEKFNVYYALATFKDGKSRKSVNVNQLRSFYMDIDCGVNKPYETQSEALIALKKFCVTVGLPKPTLINSGRGIHVYWILTEPISSEVWMPLAKKLKHLTDLHDLHVDPAVTADSARVLRMPGTLNFKDEPPLPVEFIGDIQPALSLDNIKEILGDPLMQRESYIPHEIDEVTKSLLGNFGSRFKTIMLKTLKDEGCQQLKYIYEHQAEMSEPMWRAGLSIAKFCIDADVAIEKISSKHPNYSPEETDRKVRGIKGGPHTCAKFEEYNPGGCDRCPNKGLIKSPIVLGREILRATAEDNIVEDVPENINVQNTQTYVIPDYPSPYFRGKTGGIYKREWGDDDEDDEEKQPKLIYHNDLYVTRRLLDPESGEAIVVRLHLPQDGIREFTVPLTVVTSKDELRKVLSSNGVALVKSDEIMNYITKWVNEMQMVSKADTAHRQFGWSNDSFESFVLGDKEIRGDRVDHNPPSSATAGLIASGAFDTKGSYDVWKEAMKFYARPGFEVHQLVVGISLGSILTKFTPINGTLLHLHSEDSGIGKTTAMRAALSIWGSPKKLMLQERDTMASKMNRFELSNNLMVAMDELTNLAPKDASDLAYSVTGGQQRNRLTSSANVERYRGVEWHLLAVSTGNESLIQKMGTYKAVPLAEALRILEIEVSPLLLSKKEADAFSEAIHNNYGHAYLEYVQYVINNIAAVRALYKSTQEKIDSLFGFGNPERYYSVLITGGIVGLLLGNKLGFINYDVKAVIAWLRNVMSGTKERNSSLGSDAEALLVNFLSENYNNILRIKSTEDLRKNGAEVLDHLVVPEATPRFKLIARHEYDVKMLYIHTDPLKAWCSEKHVNYNGMIESLKSGRARAKIEKKRMGKGTHMSLPPVYVLAINCEEFYTDDVEAEVADAAKHKAAVEGETVGQNSA